MTNLYSVLGLVASATTEEIRAAFRRRALSTHPDKGGSKESFHDVMLAFEILSDPARRQRYDRKITIQCFAAQTRPGYGDHGLQAVDPTSMHVKLRSERSASAAESRKVPKSSSCGSSAHCSSSKKSTCNKHQQGTEGLAPMQSSMLGSDNVREDHKQESNKKAQRLLQRLYSLLQQLPARSRRHILQNSMTLNQKSELEAFILAQRMNTSDGQLAKVYQYDEDVTDDQMSVSSCEPAFGDQMLYLEDASSSGLKYHEPSPSLLSDPVICEIEELVTGDEADADDVQHCRPTEFGSAPSDISIHDAESCVSPAPSGPCIQNRAGRSFGRGLITLGDGRYQAAVGIGSVRIDSRAEKDLSLAVDYLLVLNSMKRCYESLEGQPDARLRHAIGRALREHGATKEDLGLSFKLQISKRFWVGKLLHTPMTSDLDAVLAALSVLSPFQGNVGRKGLDLMNKVGFPEMEKQWHEFKKQYIDICAAGGQSRENVSSRVQALEDYQSQHREVQLERWNTYRMRAEEQHQRVLQKEERKGEKRSRRAMALEDHLCRRAHRAAYAHESQEERLLRRVRTLLQRWQIKIDHEAQRQSRVAKLVEQQKRRKLEQAKAKERAQASVTQKLLREQRWRAMNRRDLTMAEILERKWVE